MIPISLYPPSVPSVAMQSQPIAQQRPNYFSLPFFLCGIGCKFRGAAARPTSRIMSSHRDGERRGLLQLSILPSPISQKSASNKELWLFVALERGRVRERGLIGATISGSVKVKPNQPLSFLPSFPPPGYNSAARSATSSSCVRRRRRGREAISKLPP